MAEKSKGHGAQVLGSLIAAAVIVALAIWAVTARLGPTSIAEGEAAEERQEDAAEAAEEAREEAADSKAGGGEESGRRRRRGRD
ncbi:MAG TPA: hypothetical protein VGC35_06365 [Allosphingosinicella sp.]|jgi:uncharacterized membrane-anchored protein YhcB (DUF1043 family)